MSTRQRTGGIAAPQRGAKGEIFWWQRKRAKDRLPNWIWDIVGRRRYSARFAPGSGSYVDFSSKTVVVDPNFVYTMCPQAITLPQTWAEYDLERVGQLVVLVARALATHEAGHILATASDIQYMDPPYGGVHHLIWNRIEDQREENVTADWSHRASIDLRELGRRAHMAGYTAGQSRTTAFVNAVLFLRYEENAADYADRRGFHLPDAADDTIFWGRVAPLVREGWVAQSAHDVAEIAREIITLCQFDPDEDQPPEPGEDGQAGAGIDKAPQGQRGIWDQPIGSPARKNGAEKEGASGDQPAPDEEKEKDDGAAPQAKPGAGQPQGEEGAEGGEEDTEAECEGGGPGAEGAGADADDDSAAPAGGQPQPGRSRGDGDLSLGPDPDIVDPYCGEADGPECDPSVRDGISLWQYDPAELLAAVSGPVKRLEEEMRVRDPEADESWSNRSGRVDARAVMSTRGKKPFALRDDDGLSPDPLCLGLVVDTTGSMGGLPYFKDDGSLSSAEYMNNDHDAMPHARRATMLIHLTCERLGIPLAIASCTDLPEFRHVPNNGGYLGHVKDPVFWVKRLHDNPQSEGIAERIAGLYGHGTGAAISRGLAAITGEIAGTSRFNRTILYVHDGGPVDETPDQVRAAVKKARAQGMTVIGVFLGTGAGAREMEGMFGEDWLINVDDFARLPARMGVLLKKLNRR